MSKNSYVALIFLFGIILGVLICNIITLAAPTPAFAQTGGKAGNLIAVTGEFTQGRAGLWVIDASDSKNSPSLCLYVADGSGRAIKLAAARRIKWDLQLIGYKDMTKNRRKGDMSPGYLRRKLEEINRKEDAKAKK